MTDKELYDLARAGHPDCIPGLLAMITSAAMEILRLEAQQEHNPRGLADFTRSPRSLTVRERTVFDFVMDGMGNAPIARVMGTTEQVVKNYLRSIFTKMGVKTRLELVVEEMKRQNYAA